MGESAQFIPYSVEQWTALTTKAVLIERPDRGLIQAEGADRQAWLHNLITNDIKNLPARKSAYAFAVDVRGRVQFDLNVLNFGERLWLDVDAAYVARACAHLDRLLLSEKVILRDVSAEWRRFGVHGPGAGDVAEKLGIEWNDLAPGTLTELPGSAWLWRHDAPLLPAFDLFISAAGSPQWSSRLRDELGLPVVGVEILEPLRVEAGIPRLGRDFDETTVAPETGQIERGINYRKGCYLGQEVIERMRSRGVQARRLVRLRAPAEDGDALTALALPAGLWSGDAEVGRVTSLVRHPGSGEILGLGFLRSSAAGEGLRVGDARIAVALASA